MLQGSNETTDEIGEIRKIQDRLAGIQERLNNLPLNRQGSSDWTFVVCDLIALHFLGDDSTAPGFQAWEQVHVRNLPVPNRIHLQTGLV
jgi:hypothetical protein